MRYTEIHNPGSELSEARPLADVGDILAASGDDGTKARLVNRVDWFAIEVDDVATQIEARALLRAKGFEGQPDARIWVDRTPESPVADMAPLWDIQISGEPGGGGEVIAFRRWVQGGREVLGAFWTYWESDLPEMVDIYREDLDVDAVGPEAAKYTRQRMYEELLHVPIYDDEGFVVLKDESPFDARACFEAGEFEIFSTEVAAYKAQAVYAEAFFGSPEDAAQFRDGLEPIRVRSAREVQRAAMRKELPGAPAGVRQSRGVSRQAPARSAATRRAVPTVTQSEAPRKGFWARLLGR